MMSKKQKKRRNKTNKQTSHTFLLDENSFIAKTESEKTDLGKLFEKSFYNALSRFEEEKKPKDEHRKKNQKDRLWVTLLLFIFLPFAIRNNKMKKSYDLMLTMLISLILKSVGLVIWILGFIIPIYGIIKFGTYENFLIFIGVGIILIPFGSITVLAGKAFSEETDSAKIHAFSASIFALISCIIAIVALVK